MNEILAVAVAIVLGVGVALAISGDGPDSMKSAGGAIMQKAVEQQKEALLP